MMDEGSEVAKVVIVEEKDDVCLEKAHQSDQNGFDEDDIVCLEDHESDQDVFKDGNSTNECGTEQDENISHGTTIVENSSEQIPNGGSEVTINDDIDMEEGAIDKEPEFDVLKAGIVVGKTVEVHKSVEEVNDIVGASSDGTESLSKAPENNKAEKALNEPAEDVDLKSQSVKACEPTETVNNVKTPNDLKGDHVVKKRSPTDHSSPNEPITEELFNKLVNHLHEKDEKLVKAAKEDIAKILQTQTTRATELLVDIRKKRTRMPRRSVKILLNIIKKMCTKRKDIDTETIKRIVTFALKELTNSSQYDPIVQNAALEVLVAIGSDKHTTMVVEALTEHKEKDSVTHFMILHCLGKLTTANEKAMIPFIQPLLSTLLLPNLVDPKSVHLKQAQTYAIRCFSEALLNQSKSAPVEEATISSETPIEDIESNSSKTKESDPEESSIATKISETYNLLYNQWLHSHEPKVSVDILETLSSLGFLLTKIEKRPKLGGSGRKRMAILLRQGFGIDEARTLAQKPMSEMEYLYAPNRRRLWPQPLDNSNNISSGQKRKIHPPTPNTKIGDVKKPVPKSPIDLQRFSWKRNTEGEQQSDESKSEMHCVSKEDAVESNTEPPAKFPRRLSGAGKKRLNILLKRGMDIEQAKIKALIPLAHWKQTGLNTYKTVTKKYTRNVISKFRNGVNPLIQQGTDVDQAKVKAVKSLGHWKSSTYGNKRLQGALKNRVKTKIDVAHSKETISTPEETI